MSMIILPCLIITGLVYLAFGLAVGYSLSNMKNKKKSNSPVYIGQNLSFIEVNEVIDTVIDEVYKQKYLLHYTLKELVVIPDMNNEIKKLTTEVLDAFSESFLNEVYKYYTRQYFIYMITRKCQMLLVEWTHTHKPNTK